MDDPLEELVRVDSIDCVMKQADEDVLDLLDPVGKWSPEFTGKAARQKP